MTESEAPESIAEEQQKPQPTHCAKNRLQSLNQSHYIMQSPDIMKIISADSILPLMRDEVEIVLALTVRVAANQLQKLKHR